MFPYLLIYTPGLCPTVLRPSIIVAYAIFMLYFIPFGYFFLSYSLFTALTLGNGTRKVVKVAVLTFLHSSSLPPYLFVITFLIPCG